VKVGLGAVLFTVAAAAVATAQVVPDRSRPPVPEPPRPLRLPPIQRFTLSNGLPVSLVERREVATVEVVLVVKTGAASDPPSRAGLAAFTADILDEGAGGKDALGLADAIEYLGAGIRTGAGWDFSTVALSVPVARLEAALGLMADVALRPDFPARELQRLRRQALTALLQARAVPGQVAAQALAQAVFGGHRYGQPAGGTAASISAMRVEDLRAHHGRHYAADNASLVVVGDVTREAVAPLLEKAYGSWARGTAAAATALAAPRQVTERRLVLVDKPGAAQSVLRVGRVGPPRSTPDFHELEVMNTLLGGSFTSRLNDSLREQHGYAYGAGSSFGYRQAGGIFQAAADVQTQSTSEALAELMKELQRIGTPPTAEEAERARNYLALGYAEEFETNAQVASKVAEQIVYGLPEDFYATFVPRALAVGPAEIQRVGPAADPTHAVIVVVGDRKAIEPGLRALGLGPIVVRTVDDVLGPAPRVE
jgi:predicted Zn-dependent peptidase